MLQTTREAKQFYFFRTLLGYSCSEICGRIGVHPANVSAFENGRAKLAPKRLQMALDLFKSSRPDIPWDKMDTLIEACLMEFAGDYALAEKLHSLPGMLAVDIAIDVIQKRILDNRDPFDVTLAQSPMGVDDGDGVIVSHRVRKHPSMV